MYGHDPDEPDRTGPPAPRERSRGGTSHARRNAEHREPEQDDGKQRADLADEIARGVVALALELGEDRHESL